MKLSCVECGKTTDSVPADCGCPACAGLLEVSIEPGPLPPAWRDRPLGVWRYKEFLPPVRQAPITLGEGGTRLVSMPRLAERAGVRSLHVKVEGGNPTGSFKDRGMTCAVTHAVDGGATILGCASTGNTAASMAAYGARAGLPAVVLLPADQVALGKVAQAMAHGARVLEIEGSFDDAMELVIGLASDGRMALLNSKNPVRLEGQKTLMFEVIDQADTMPDRVIYPVGNAGNISAGHKALREYEAAGLIEGMPRLTGIQAEGASPVAKAIAAGAEVVTPEASPETIATAIRIGRPVSAVKALRAIRETDGTATSVPDQAIRDAQGLLAREGVFCEPASAASVAGLLRLAEAGDIDAHEEVVCVLTGHGLKDPKAAEALSAGTTRVAATRAAIEEALA